MKLKVKANLRKLAEEKGNVDSQVEEILKKFHFNGNQGPKSNDSRDFLNAILDLGFKKGSGKQGEHEIAKWTCSQSQFEFVIYLDAPKSKTGEVLDKVYAYKKQ